MLLQVTGRIDELILNKEVDIHTVRVYMTGVTQHSSLCTCICQQPWHTLALPAAQPQVHTISSSAGCEQLAAAVRQLQSSQFAARFPTGHKLSNGGNAGHSLGGALAELAAHHFATCAREQGNPYISRQLACYTFGAPRVGNAAWAAECGAMIPAMFHVINDQVCSQHLLT